MPIKKLKDFLDKNKVKYITIRHSPAYTAQEIAAHSHIPGKELAKTVMVKIEGEMAMAILPASCHIDFGLLKKALGIEDVKLASEDEFKNMFPECDVGGMPPFGNLYGMDVYVAESLVTNEDISFNAGTHTELISLKYKDYEKLAKPKVLKYSVQW
jgi:Ala-tRNA(Pro) deacylase